MMAPEYVCENTFCAVWICCSSNRFSSLQHSSTPELRKTVQPFATMSRRMDNYREFWDAPQNEVPVRGFLHQPAHSTGDCLVLTHGAGTNCDSPLLVALAGAFCASGLTV